MASMMMSEFSGETQTSEIGLEKHIMKPISLQIWNHWQYAAFIVTVLGV